MNEDKTCPDCERYKQSASMWRNKAYELGGTPLPWKRDELWVGLTDKDTDVSHLAYSGRSTDYIDGYEAGMEAAEAKLKEKNHV